MSSEGHVPVLIVSRDIFSKITSTVVIVPITSGGAFARRTGYVVSLEAAGTKTAGVIRFNQLRTIDIIARQGRRLETVPQEIMEEVLAKVESLFL